MFQMTATRSTVFAAQGAVAVVVRGLGLIPTAASAVIICVAVALIAAPKDNQLRKPLLKWHLLQQGSL